MKNIILLVLILVIFSTSCKQEENISTHLLKENIVFNQLLKTSHLIPCI